MSDHVKIRELADEWAPEIGVNPTDLAKALVLAALDGEFDKLPPLHRATLFDEVRLAHEPIVAGQMRYEEAFVQLSIRTGWAYIHREAVTAFACAEGRRYAMPRRWSRASASCYDEVLKIISQQANPIKKEVKKIVISAGVYSKDPFEDAWRDRPAEMKNRGGRPRRNPSRNPS